MLGEALALYETLKEWTRGKQIILFPSADLRETTSCRAHLFLTGDATIGNQALSRQCCNILSYSKVKITFLNSVRKNDVEAQVEP